MLSFLFSCCSWSPLFLHFAKHLLSAHILFLDLYFIPYAWFSCVFRSSYTLLNFLTWSSWTLGVILVSVTDEKRSKWISQISFPWIPHTSSFVQHNWLLITCSFQTFIFTDICNLMIIKLTGIGSKVLVYLSPVVTDCYSENTDCVFCLALSVMIPLFVVPSPPVFRKLLSSFAAWSLSCVTFWLRKTARSTCRVKTVLCYVRLPSEACS